MEKLNGFTVSKNGKNWNALNIKKKKRKRALRSEYALSVCSTGCAEINK